MAYLRSHGWLVGLALGLLAGLVVGGIWPNTPLHAVATDRVENYAIATGFVDDESEAIFFLDVLTGKLRAAVLSRQTQNFFAHYEANLNGHLATMVNYMNQQAMQSGGATGPAIQVPQSPQYMMVTGNMDLRRGAAARMAPSRSVIYVAETNTGIVMAFVIPWDTSAAASNRPTGGMLELWAGERFASAMLRQP